MSSSKHIAEWLVERWTTRLGEILLTMGDLQASMQTEASDDSAIENGLLWWEQPFSCTAESPMCIGAPEDSWTEIGKLVLVAAGVDDGPPSEWRSTYLEIVRQSVGSLAQDIGQRIGSQVSCLNGSEEKPQKSGRQHFQVGVELPGKTINLLVIIPDDLCRSILLAEKANAEPSAPAREQSVQLHNDGSLPSQTFELLLDVEMPVSVSFGRATLKLQDAIKLITGSLIELDRTLTDPVELLVNNCVIARGEVVVVEGNYGLRITEIVSQKQRLQQTRRYMLL